MLNSCYKTQAFTGPTHSKQKKDVAVCIAGGPSLTKEDVWLVEQSGHIIFGINNAYQITDKLTYHYACDTKWWRNHYVQTHAHTYKYSLKKDKGDEGYKDVRQMERGHRNCLSSEWPILCTGGNSGYQVVNLAYLLGYTKIILLGYDMQNTNGRCHWHGNHQFCGSTNPAKNTFKKWREDFNKMANIIEKMDLQVINSTRKTALECFPKVPLEEVLWS